MTTCEYLPGPGSERFRELTGQVTKAVIRLTF